MKHYPEEKVNTRSIPDGMSRHLQPIWCTVRNEIAGDQEGIARCLDSIKAQKKTIKFLKSRVVCNLNALDAIEKVS